MPPPLDLTGQTFGRLVVVQRMPGRPRRWLCRCDCGRQLELAARQLSYRRSCGNCPAAPCRVCDGKVVSRAGFCHRHNERWRRWGRPDPAEWAAAFVEGRLNTCAVCGKRWNGHHGGRHCSPACLAAWRRERALARYHALSPQEKRVASKRALERGRARRREGWSPRRCVACGEEFLGPDWRVTCGARACRSANITRGSRAYRARRAALEVAEAAAQLERKISDA